MAQQPTLEWEQRFNMAGNSSDYAISVAMDAEGNSYVTGTSIRQDFLSRITTVKYASSGEQLWKATVQEISNARGIAVDNSGGVYITGESNGDYLTIRYDAATGNQTWVQHYDGPSNSYDEANALVVDNTGGVYVTGSSIGEHFSDYATVRYDAATGEQTWVQHYNGPENNIDVATAIAYDNASGIYVTGISNNTAFVSDYATVRYDAKTGNQIWVQRYDGPASGDDQAVAIAADNIGGVYVTGTSIGRNKAPDYATIRYDATTGNQAWVQRYDGTGKSHDQATAIAVDDAGGVYVTGHSFGPDSNTNFATVRYEATTGEQMWVQHYDSPAKSPDYAKAVGVDNAGGVYVTGSSGGMDFITDYATVRYDATTGAQTWVQRYNGPAGSEEQATAMAVGNAGVIVTGSSLDSEWSSDYATVRYATSTGEQTWIQRLAGADNSDDYSVSVAVDAEGNSYVAGTSMKQENFSQLTTVKYSPSGEQLWVVQYENYSIAADIAVDNEGNVFVTGHSNGDYLTIRYDASTGEQAWVQRYDGPSNNYDQAYAIAVDNSRGVYVTGLSTGLNLDSDYATVRYDAITGEQSWVQHYDGSLNIYDVATAIAVDNAGGVYVTGSSLGTEYNSDYATIRYDASTGEQMWVRRYVGPDKGVDNAIGIAADKSGVYVTGSSGFSNYTTDFATVHYSTTGEQIWAQHYDGPVDGYEWAIAIALDNSGGVYVTGSSEGLSYNSDYATIRYDAATGEQLWVQRYEGSPNVYNTPRDIMVDNSGGVYVTGLSQVDDSNIDYATVRYAAATGEQIWEERYDSMGESIDVAVDMAIDNRGNIIVTGYSDVAETGVDFLTIKYSQCLVLAEADIAGGTTAAVGTAGVLYSLPGTGASSFTWSITDSDGMAYTDFTGQGTEAVAVTWPSVPDFYKVAVTYGGNAGCPTITAVMYVHVFDPEAGFVTGNGWIESPVNSDYEFMQDSKRAHWSFSARYIKDAENTVQGATNFTLQAGAFAFRSTSIDDRTLVITDNTAYFRGRGTASYEDNSGGFVTDSRQFGYLVAATDGQFQENTEADKFRLVVWVINEDGSQGAIVYDNQVACLSSGMDLNMPPCSAIGQGFIVIHKPITRSVSGNGLAYAEYEQRLEAYPTAFSDHTTLAFALEQDATAYTLDLYDMKGTLVQRIAAGTAESERRYEHELRAGSLAKGLYLARLTTGSKVQTVKLIVQH
ncbi:SBBP repeat-containing protein [Pontibacter diazotrophicus]|nr:SBBP repeat-containing protein [Pontibacter diazotrophicus]